MSAAWLMRTLSARLTKAELEALIDEMPPRFRGNPTVYPGSKQLMLAFVAEARERYWSNPPRPSLRPVQAATITAREVDEWLATLPPVPPA